MDMHCKWNDCLGYFFLKKVKLTTSSLQIVVQSKKVIFAVDY